jgi:Holliday junction resolvase RusA-like endonuclease
VLTEPLSPRQELCFSVPLTPISVNHYKMRTRKGVTFVSSEARAFKQALAIFAAGRSISAKEYVLEVRVYFGKNQKGDGDNLWKCIGDGLKECGVIRSDAAVKRWVMEVDRDWECPRTEIAVSEFRRRK